MLLQLQVSFMAMQIKLIVVVVVVFVLLSSLITRVNCSSGEVVLFYF